MRACAWPVCRRGSACSLGISYCRSKSSERHRSVSRASSGSNFGRSWKNRTPGSRRAYRTALAYRNSRSYDKTPPTISKLCLICASCRRLCRLSWPGDRICRACRSRATPILAGAFYQTLLIEPPIFLNKSTAICATAAQRSSRRAFKKRCRRPRSQEEIIINCTGLGSNSFGPIPRSADQGAIGAAASRSRSYDYLYGQNGYMFRERFRGHRRIIRRRV